MDKVDTTKWRYYHDSDEGWTKESIEEHRERKQTEEERIDELRRLHDLHSDLNEQMDGWEEVLSETRENLQRALG